jgi:hypothetical protein
LLTIAPQTFFLLSFPQHESSVADPDPNPDPHVFGPPGSGSGSISKTKRYGPGSGSFYHQTKMVTKTLIPTALGLLFDFLSLKMMKMYLQEVKSKKNFYNKK